MEMDSCADGDQHQQAISYFDRIPDDHLLIIFNKLLDARSLVRCLCVSKRFASLIPLTDAVFLPLCLPPRPPSLRQPPRTFTVNFFKSLFSYLITKPLHLLRHHHHRRSLSASPYQCPDHLLNTFYAIKSLHLELHSNGGRVDSALLKWKANFGTDLKCCVVICATSLEKEKSLPEIEDEQEQAPPSLENEELKSRILWTISCLIAASARHFLLKQMLLKFSALKRVVITDSNKQGRFWMEEEEIGELRHSLEEGTRRLLLPEGRVVPDLRMKMWHVPHLQLPASGCVMKGATLLVISPAGEMAAENESNPGGFDGDEAERAVFGEAEREIVRKTMSNYVLEMTSF